MSFESVWLWTLIRSLLLIVLALPWCGYLVRWIKTSPGGMRGWQLWLLAAPFLFPELLTGYAYSQMTRLLITGWWTREVWFDLLLLLRVIPIGTLLWYCAPPSALSREAWHVRRLALRDDVPSWKRVGILIWYWLQGPARTALFAACGLFLVLFQEFELASLLATTSWTVWLFDAQAGGLSLSESLRCCLAPAFCTWLICGALPWKLCGTALHSADRSTAGPPPSPGSRLVLWGYLLLALGLIVIYPCYLIGREAVPGLTALVRNHVHLRGIVQGILVAGGYGLIAGLLADLIAGWLMEAGPDNVAGRFLPRPVITRSLLVKLVRGLILAGCGLGLCGSLIISLAGVAIFQNSALRPVYDTPLPVILGLVIWLLPRALLLRAMLVATRSPTAEHTARLLITSENTNRTRAARQILWTLSGRSATAVRLLLCYWAYCDLTLPNVLTPAGFVSAPVRLYIDMHFGRNAMLTAKAGLTFAAPLILIALCWPWIKRNSTS